LIKLKTPSFTDDWGEMNGRGRRCARRPRLWPTVDKFILSG
jgi:hypothetical protein